MKIPAEQEGYVAMQIHQYRYLCWVLSLVAAAVFCGCSAKRDGSEFVGKWAASDGSSFEIKKSGDTYVLSRPGGPLQFPAVYDKQQHILNVSMGLVGQIPLSYDTSTHKLLAMNNEFSKTSGDEGSGPATKEDASNSKRDQEALAFGKQLMMPNLTVCDGRTFAMLDEGGGGTPYLAEIKNPTFSVDSGAVSKADGLNGIDYQGSVWLKWESDRVFYRGRWSDWLDPDNPPIALAVANREQILIVHKNGQWVHSDSYSAKQDFVGLRRKPISCESLPKK